VSGAFIFLPPIPTDNSARQVPRRVFLERFARLGRALDKANIALSAIVGGFSFLNDLMG
jgi:hypothetical protein